MSKLANWHEEKQSAWLYRILVEVEPEIEKRELFQGLAKAAESQADIWERELRRDGEPVPARFRPSTRARLAGLLLRRIGPRAIRPALAALKVRGISVYSGARPAGHPMPTTVAQVGGRHKGVAAGGNLRAAVFGVNDGLVSNTSLIMGVAGATSDVAFVLTSGVAGLLAGALSMAAGEYISMRSQRELFEYQIGLERDELAEYPEEETEELALIYHARGLPKDKARAFAAALMRSPEHALDTLAREELGLNPDELGSPLGAAASSFAAFTGGAVIPLIPFLLGLGDRAVITAAALAAAGLFAIGALLSLFTGRGALASGLRMTAIGAGAGALTYVIGSLFGVGLS